MVPEIIFQKIVSTADGQGATEGRYMEKYFNGNFDKVKTLLTSLFQVVSVQVSSENVTQIKVDTTTDPYSLYYTIDPIGTAEPNWILLTSTFANLLGKPSDNIALKTELESKASKEVTDTLVVQVGKNTDNITEITKNVTKNQDDIEDLQLRLNNVDGTLDTVVHTDGSGAFYIRYNAYLNTVEYSTTAQTDDWHSVIATNINFLDIQGLPEDNALLVEYVNNVLSSITGNFISMEELVKHTSDYNNPHQVTAEQVGLGNIQNEVDALKGAANLANNNTLTKYLNEEQADDLVCYISSHYVNTAEIGSFVQVALLTGTQTYKTVDGLVVSINTDPQTLPQWYNLVLSDDEPISATVYYNEELRTYMLGGGA